MKIAILVFPGADELDFIAPFEVLDTARRHGGDLTVTLVALRHEPALAGFHGLLMKPLHVLREEDAYDMVLVPGGTWLSGEMTGIRKEIAEGTLSSILKKRHSEGAIIASVCTGAFGLEAAGLLRDRPATTHHSAYENLRQLGVDVKTERVVDSGTILTAGGVTSGLDLALWIVERFFGPDLAAKVESYLQYERQGTVFRTE